MYNKTISEIGKSRLHTIRNSNDGFYIAEKDLDLRGPGEIFGSKQSGEENFRLFTLKDFKLLEIAKKISEKNSLNSKVSYSQQILMSIFNNDEYIQNLN
tara:strand:+ start:26 stop:322 length:297 start_codon:yes stop_codon:yes gene_type:complete